MKPPALTVIQARILTLRAQRVMLDADLAKLYQVPTKRLNEQGQTEPSALCTGVSCSR